MKKRIWLFGFVLISCFINCYAQSVASWKEKERELYAVQWKRRIEAMEDEHYKKVKPLFQKAYVLYPSIPRGMLEAVSYYYTRFVHLSYDVEDIENQEDIPRVYGVMGLTMEGKGVFRRNLEYVARLSKRSVEEIVSEPEQNVLAYAAAFARLQKEMKIHSSTVADYVPILMELSELPLQGSAARDFAMNAYLYAIYSFLSSPEWCRRFDVPCRLVDLDRIFGDDLPMLRLPRVFLALPEQESGENERKELGSPRKTVATNDVDYAGALWVPAGTCNYTSMSSRNVSSVAIHYTSGTYSGAIAWFQNCTYNGVGARASAHYVIRSFDGQVTQMVREKDKAWHVGTANSYTIGIEHEAYGNVAEYFTPAMYQASADLLRDICQRHQIDPHRMFYRDTLDDGTQLNQGLRSLGNSTACTKIRGHQHYPEQTHTDPGPYWAWNYYYKLVNVSDSVMVLSSDSGTLTDSGGAEENYGNDERALWLIEVPDADSIVLEFSEFELEKDYDFLWIYDGNSEYSPLLGRWNTHSPGRVVSSGNALMLEFRSDCGTTKRGWQAAWRAIFPPQPLDSVPQTLQPPTTEIVWNDSTWVVRDTVIRFVDESPAAIENCFYQVMEYDGSQWKADGQNGFLCNNFDAASSLIGWTSRSGQWGIVSGELQQSDATILQSQIAVPLNGLKSDAYLYDFYVKPMALLEQSSAVVTWFAVDDADNLQNGYALKILPNEHKLTVCKMADGNSTILATCSDVYTSTNQSYRYRIVHDRRSGIIKVFRHATLLCVVQDEHPLAAANHFVWQTERCAAAFDHLRVYRSRGDEVLLRVGRALGNDLRHQAASGAACAKLKSIVLDTANTFSSLVEKRLLVDFTPPSPPTRLNVQPDYTLSLGTVPQEFMVTWEAVSEGESGLSNYEVFLCPVRDMGLPTNPDWQQVGTEPYYRNSNFVMQGLRYQLWVRARDKAGWCSPAVASTEFTVISLPQGGQMARERQKKQSLSENAFSFSDTFASLENTHVKVYPNPATTKVFLEGVPPATDILLYDAQGNLLRRFRLSANGEVDVAELSQGIYFMVTASGKISFVKV